VVAAQLVRILQARQPKVILRDDSKPAAVLVPVQETDQGDCVVLTQRAPMLSFHRGQVAFPGGRVDPEDAGPQDAALRESWEEIGLHPRDVRVLGQLDQVTASSNHVVTPFVGLIPFPYEFRLNPAETTAVFTVPISALMERGCFSEETSDARRHWGPVYHFRYQQWDIWGATAGIVKQFLELGYGFKAPAEL
jgi:8-oxo-dGTP pyrophosphatase MutT (NUDIX family)